VNLEKEKEKRREGGSGGGGGGREGRTSHVFAAVVTHALHHRQCPRVTDAETLAGLAAEEGLEEREGGKEGGKR